MSKFTSAQPAPGEGFYTASIDINLTETSTDIETAGYFNINLYSDSTTSSDRQIFLRPGKLEGQKLNMTLLSGNSTTCLMSTAGVSYIRIKAAWTPVEYNQISLQWVKGLWIEVSRSAVNETEFKPDITDPQNGDILIYNNGSWENLQMGGEFELNESGVGDFRFVESPSDGQVLTYDSAIGHWTNETPTGPPATIVWNNCTTQANFTGTVQVAEVSTNLYVFKGELTSSNGTNGVMFDVPSGFELTGSTTLTGNFVGGGASYSTVSYGMDTDEVRLKNTGDTIFTGYRFNFDNVFYIKE